MATSPNRLPQRCAIPSERLPRKSDHSGVQSRLMSALGNRDQVGRAWPAPDLESGHAFVPKGGGGSRVGLDGRYRRDRAPRLNAYAAIDEALADRILAERHVRQGQQERAAAGYDRSTPRGRYHGSDGRSCSRSCGRCRTSGTGPSFVRDGFGDRPIHAARPRCRKCGSMGEWQVRPPTPAFHGATWMQD